MTSVSSTAETENLGTCPRCEESIPSGNVLISYDTPDGESVYAECPDCREPVHPV